MNAVMQSTKRRQLTKPENFWLRKDNALPPAISGNPFSDMSENATQANLQSAQRAKHTSSRLMEPPGRTFEERFLR
jgi:hypothetical protein